MNYSAYIGINHIYNDMKLIIRLLIYKIQLKVMKANICSSRIGSQIVCQVLAATDKKIEQVEFIKANMNSYSCNRMISLVNELGDQLLSLPNQFQTIRVQQQPQNLNQDNFMSVNNLETVQQHDIVVEKAQTISEHKSTSRSVKNYKKPTVKKQEQKDEIKSRKTQQKSDNLHKLKQEEKDSRDGEIDSIRLEKQRILKQEKQLQMRKSQNQQKKTRISKEGFNFDYNGSILDLKTDKKNNLVSKMVIPKIPTDQQNVKQTTILQKDKLKGTFLKTQIVKEGEQKNKKKTNKNRESQKFYYEEKVEINFSKIKNPIENIEVKQGVKATFNQNVIQKQKKKLNDEELKKSRSTRKLSKNQYERIKATTLRSKKQENREQNFEDLSPIVIIKKKQDTQGQKQFSLNLKKRAVTEVDNEKIRVQDDFLKRELIQKTKTPDTVKEVRRVLDDRPSSQIKKKQQLSKMDKYNLDYSRNKTQYSAMKKMSDYETVLPKIHLNTQGSNLPKVREKLKEASSIRRELLKKFEDSLRV